MAPGSVVAVETPDGSVTVEGFAYTVRYHPAGAYGDPFTFVCSMTRHGDEAVLFAGLGDVTPAVRRAIVTALKSIGIAVVHYDRRNAGRVRHREVHR